MHIESFFEYLIHERNYSLNTVKAYRTDLEALASFCSSVYQIDSIDKLEYNIIRSWIVKLVESNVSNRTVNRKVSSLKSYYKFLQEIEVISMNPLSKHKSLKVKIEPQTPFSMKEVKEVLMNLEEGSFEALRDKVIIDFLFSTGIRRSELTNLRVKDVNLSSESVKVLGKRNKERIVPLLSDTIRVVEKYVSFRNKLNLNNEFLLVTSKGNKIYETLVYRVINSYFSKVSSKVKCSPHILRHTFATELLNKGADLNSVKELLGHSSLASTQVYTHNNLEQLKQVFNRAHPRSQKKD
ncbi:integrase [Tenacibaculum sp. SZ-18]|uniref:tyrosine-type recombinase/integrase n=1 Tax=Tenacibaculum sp. SZ-18 TaxID=754423 RepID=UPI000C2CF786|nr:tyrosine-type recombinase/integrase [Tenacibaculum sp. SZ-18]AUC14260.1 integrase [Tenacibaculum sp. SZ-18]